MRALLRYARYLLGALLLLLPFPAAAQSDINLRIDQLDAGAFPEMRLFVSVTDAQRRAIANLGIEHFVLVENGRAVPIASVANAQPDDIQLRVVLALDISGSIKPGLSQIKQAAIDFVRTLKPSDQVALILFGNQSRRIHDFTSDHEAVISTITALGPGSLEDSTALYNGAFEAVRLAANLGGGRRAVVLLTDGKNAPSAGAASLTLSDVQREATDRHVPIHVIGVGPEVSDQALRLLASSGRYYRVDQPGEVAAAYQSIADQLRQQYEIRYVSSLAPDGKTYELELKVNVPDVGAVAASTPLQIAPPETPFVRLALPEQITIGHPAAIRAEIFSRNPPRSVALLLNGQMVASEPLNGRLWAYSWTPDITLAPEAYQLDVRVTDTLGAESTAAPHHVILEAPRTPLVRASIPGQMTIGRPVTITAAVAARNPPQRVEVLLDGEPVVSDMLEGQVWTYVWTPDESLAPGDYQVDVRVTDGSGAQSLPAPLPVKLEAAAQNLLWILIPAILLILLAAGAAVLVGVRPWSAGKPSGAALGASFPLPVATGGATGNTGASFAPIEASGVPQALLLVERGAANPRQVPLFAGRDVEIGRHPGSDLVLDDMRVSAHHARISVVENGFTIVDLGSTNGLRVNGRRVDQMRLQQDDQIEVGDAVLVFKQLH